VRPASQTAQTPLGPTRWHQSAGECKAPSAISSPPRNEGKPSESGASKAKIAYLQAAADKLKAQRVSLFRGETLRGLLLSSYACRPSDASGIAAWVAFAGAAVMAALVTAGLVHLRHIRA
jgi:hypothetical protein